MHESKASCKLLSKIVVTFEYLEIKHHVLRSKILKHFGTCHHGLKFCAITILVLLPILKAGKEKTFHEC